MNFCIDCKYCVEHSCEYGYDHYCYMPTQKYDYVTGEKIITFAPCSSIRKDKPICEYFEQKPPKWYKTLFKKLITKLDTGTKLEA